MNKTIFFEDVLYFIGPKAESVIGTSILSFSDSSERK